MKITSAVEQKKKAPQGVRSMVWVGLLAVVFACSDGGKNKNRLEVGTPTFERHDNAAIGAEGQPVPAYFFSSGAEVATVELCVPTEDRERNHWSAEMRLGHREGRAYMAAPTAADPAGVCFRRALPLDTVRVLGEDAEAFDEIEICSRVVDDRGSSADLGCLPVLLVEDRNRGARSEIDGDSYKTIHGFEPDSESENQKRLEVGTPTFERHPNAPIGASGQPVPAYFFSPEAKVATVELCVPTEEEKRKHWSIEMRLGNPEGRAYLAAPTAANPAGVCFRRALALDAVRVLGEDPQAFDEIEICSRVVDDRGSSADLGCLPVLLVEDRNRATRSEINGDLYKAIHGFEPDSESEDPPPPVQPCQSKDVERTDAKEATQECLEIAQNAIDKLPADELRQTFRTALMAGYWLRERRHEGDLKTARTVVESILKDERYQSLFQFPAYREVTGQAYLELAQVALKQRQFADASDRLTHADDHLLATVSPSRISVFDIHTQMIRRQGAVDYAIEVMERAIAECNEYLIECPEDYLDTIGANSAWMVVNGSSVSTEELRGTVPRFRAALRLAQEKGEQKEIANQQVNLLLAEQLLDERGVPQDSERTVAERIRLTQDTLRESNSPYQHLIDWLEVILARIDLATGTTVGFEAALEKCADILENNESKTTDDEVSVAAAAALCAGQAAMKLGEARGTRDDLEEAGRHFNSAKKLSKSATKAAAGIWMGPGQQSDAYYGVAAALASINDGKAAWDELAELDCLETREGAARPRDDSLMFRIFWLDEKIWILERGYSTYKTLDLSREDLIRTKASLAQIASPDEPKETDLESLDPGSWDEPFRSLAAYLLEQTSSAEVIEIGLYGALQIVPLDAIELKSGGHFGDNRTVALRPACSTTSLKQDALEGPGLVVIDPTENLSGARHIETVKDLFKHTPVVLKGGNATLEAFQEELEREPRWLHIGAHGKFNAAYPPLSAIFFAGEKRFRLDQDWKIPPLVLANLSACDTGRSPMTAGSGQFGFGGLFTRAGTRWVIATTDRIKDSIAQEFNEKFYPALAASADVPASYRLAMNHLRANYPLEDWFMLRLLASGIEDPS